jgi:type III secretion protein Y
MTQATGEAVELLHALGSLYGVHGQVKRGLALLVIAARLAPDHVGVLRSLAHAFLADRSPQRAMPVINRLRQLDGGDHPVVALMASHAAWAIGETREARLAFRDFLDRSKGARP